MNFKRYIEVYDNYSDELLYSYEIKLNDKESLFHINPDKDDPKGMCVYVLNKKQVMSLSGNYLINKFKGMDVEYHSSFYLD